MSAAGPSRSPSAGSQNTSQDAFSSGRPLASPRRHHQRTVSANRTVKETRNARSEYRNSEDDGTSQHRINQYLIQQEIGRGSFGAVHLATDQYGQEYAVKEFSKSRLRRRAKSNLLRRARQQTGPGQPRSMFTAPMGSSKSQNLGQGDDETSFNLIKEEIAVMKKLNHGNLVSLIEVLDDPDEDSLYMVLEMCKKGVVMHVEVDHDADPYDEESCRCWFRDLILAIEYLHAQGVVHRDIKPDNCLLTDDDTLKVVDFGVSEMFEKDSDMKIAKSAGSPAFMAPELCTVRRGDVYGKPADIWSMGVTLFCLRFGRVPFQKTAVLDLYQSIVNDQLHLPTNCGEDFTDLILRLLEKDPDKRIKMEQIRDHPWVTCKGTDLLLPVEENCADIVSLPTEEEKNAAITSNMGHIFAVVKAVHRFKALIARKRPDLVESILGRASQIVQPPLSFTKANEDGRTFLKKPPSNRRQEGSQSEIQLPDLLQSTAEVADGRVGLPKSQTRPSYRQDASYQSAGAETSANTRVASTRAPEAKDVDDDVNPVHRRHHTVGRGQAHNPLEDHLFLDIGIGPAEGEDDKQPHDFSVCESPSAADDDVYASAYHEEVDKIHGSQGHEAIVYMTRRIENAPGKGHHGATASESGHHSSSRLADIFGRAVRGGQTSMSKLSTRSDDE